MTLASRLLAWFPALQLALILATLIALAADPAVWSLLAVAFAVYGLPLVLFRLLARLVPLEEGVSRLDGRRYSAWWGGHQLQAIYLAVPALEAVLRLVPGLFSLWLRAWGSAVGRGVYWTPGLEIADRSLLRIGDRAVFGHRVGLYAHLVAPKRGHLVLYVKRITIGSDVFVGAGTRMGPGVRIDDGVTVPVLSDLYPNHHLRHLRHLRPGSGAGDADLEPRRPGARAPLAGRAAAAR